MEEIESIEIENPFRYRAYKVGETPMYDIQNCAYVGGYDSSVKVEKIYFDEGIYTVNLSNGDLIELRDNQSGMIATHKKVSK